MQIQHQGLSSSSQLERQNLIKEGELYRATVKERTGQQEAIVSIRGRDVSVTFEGTFPDKERVHVRVTESRAEPISVRVIEEQPRQTNSDRQTTSRQVEMQQRLHQLGVHQPSNELVRAALILHDKGISLSKNAANDLQQFMLQGNKNERLQSVEAVANKRLEVTMNHLRAVDEALHGRPLNQVLNELARELELDFKRPTREQTNQQSTRTVQVDELKQLIQTNPKQAVEKIAQMASGADTKETSRLAGEAKQLLQAASDRVLQAIPQTREWNTVRQEIENRGITDRIKEQMTRLDAPNREQIDRVLNQAQQLQKEAWNRINQAITQLERSVKNEQDPVRFKQDVVQQIVRTIGMAANQKQAADQVQTFLIRENIEPIPSSRLQQLVENVRHHLNQGREEAAVRQITAALQTEGSTEGETRPLVQVFNRESAQQVQEIMRQIQGSGSTEQTVERIQALLSKQSPTQVQQLVENVRQLLNQGREETAVRQITAFVEGDANRSSEVRPVQQIERQPGQLVQEVLRQIQTSVNSQQSVERIEALFKNENRAISLTQVQQLVESVRQYVSQGRVEAANQLIDASLSQITASSNTNVAQVNSGGDGQSTSASPSLFVEQAMRLLQSEPHIGRVIEQMQARIEQLPVQDSVKVEVVQQLVDAKQTAQSGREMKARQEVAQVIQQIEQQVQPTIPNKETAAYIVNEQFQTSEQASSKMIAVTTVSEKMAQLAADFKQFQREMHRTLDQTARLIEQVRKQANVQAKPLLEKTISRLDQTILKSEMMLFTDMKTERELMQASNRLAEAKQLLAKGSYREASQIVREVNQLVEKVHFQPSETKVKHYTAAREEALRNMQLPEQALTKQLSETLRPIPEPSPRAMLELMRSLGLNRDQELAQQLVTGNREQVAEQQNLKSLLLQLARGEEEGSRTQQLANQALNNLTGQQLLSRSDQQSMQSLFFQLPFLLEEKVENLKVFVNSRNEGEKVDWENCSIYFLMQTPKMGEIGILVSVKDRQLSVTLKNDQTDFQSKMEPLVQQSIENLGDLGFQIKGIHYSPLQSQDQEEGQKGNDDIQQRATFTEKGFDYRI